MPDSPRFPKVLLLTLLCIAKVFGGDTATLRIYRYHAKGAWRQIHVYADGRDVGGVDDGHYRDIQLPAGRHDLRGPYKRQHLILNMEPNSVSYLRADCGITDGWHADICVVDPQTGAAETSGMPTQR